jgi:hypothetical protein
MVPIVECTNKYDILCMMPTKKGIGLEMWSVSNGSGHLLVDVAEGGRLC